MCVCVVQIRGVLAATEVREHFFTDQGLGARMLQCGKGAWGSSFCPLLEHFQTCFRDWRTRVLTARCFRAAAFARLKSTFKPLVGLACLLLLAVRALSSLFSGLADQGLDCQMLQGACLPACLGACLLVLFRAPETGTKQK